jgi:hypothetical protein
VVRSQSFAGHTCWYDRHTIDKHDLSFTFIATKLSSAT